MTTNYFKWSLSISSSHEASNRIVSASVNSVIDADSTCNIVFSISSIGDIMEFLPMLGSSIVLTVNGTNLFSGKVMSSKVSINTYSVECSDNFMLKLQDGTIKELDFVSSSNCS